MSFDKISNILDKKYGQTNFSRKVSAALVCDEFNKLLIEVWGKKIEDQAQAMYVKDKVLTVACLSPIVAQEVKMKEGGLIQKINVRFKQKTITKIRLLT